jgi:hypothetical protein
MLLSWVDCASWTCRNQKIKHCSSCVLPMTCTMAIIANLKYFGKEQESMKCVKSAWNDSHMQV